jgi:hypothetical protein
MNVLPCSTTPCDTRAVLPNDGVGGEAATETSGFSPIGTIIGSVPFRRQVEARQVEGDTQCPSR